MRSALCRQPLLFLGIAAILLAVTVERACAALEVGNAATVVREVHGLLEAQTRTLIIDSDVYLNEEITTGPGSATRLLFKDGTNLEMGENSRLKLTRLVFDPDPAKSALAVKALQGVFRWTSGKLPSSAYSIATPVATIGIRGTTLEFIVGDEGLTTVALSRGKIVVSNMHGASVDLSPGEATTVMPPDPDGNQAAPSAPGELSAALTDEILQMTRTVRANEVEDSPNPGAGGGQQQNNLGPNNLGKGPGPINFFRGLNNGADNGNPGGPPGPPPPPPVFPLVPQPPSGSIVGPTDSGPKGGSGPPVTSGLPADPGPKTPTGPDPGPPVPPVGDPGPGAGNPPGGTPKTYVATVNFESVPQGGTREVALALKIGKMTIVLTDYKITGSSANLFSLRDFRKGFQLTGDDAFFGFIDFSPGTHDVGQATAELELTDNLGDIYTFELVGTIAAIVTAEPAALPLLGMGLFGVFLVRRRRKKS